MNSAVRAVLLAAMALPASAEELFSGTHTYRPDYDLWSLVPAAGWVTSVMVGEYEPRSGPVADGGKYRTRWEGAITLPE
jgi:hypothetical protein